MWFETSELNEVIENDGRGYLLFTAEDVKLPPGAEFCLAPGETFDLPPMPVAMDWLGLPKSMWVGLDLRSMFGQAGVTITRQEYDSEGLIHATIENRGPRTVASGQNLAFGKLVAKGEPMDSVKITNEFSRLFTTAPLNTTIDPYTNCIWLPVTRRFQYDIEDSNNFTPFDLSQHNAHDRTRLHRGLRVSPYDETILKAHSRTELSATDALQTDRSICLWVGRGLKVHNEELASITHHSSKLLQPGDVPWRIMLETTDSYPDFAQIEVYNRIASY